MIELYVGLAVVGVCVLFGAVNVVKAIFTVYTYTRQSNGTFERDHPGREFATQNEAMAARLTIERDNPDKLVDIRREEWRRK